MSGLVERARRAAEARADAVRTRVAARLTARLPGARCEIVGDVVVVRGRDLVARWIAADPAQDLREVER